MTKKTETKDAIYIYLGLREDIKGRLYHAYLPFDLSINENEEPWASYYGLKNIDDELWFKATLANYDNYPGNIYKVKEIVNEDNTVSVQKKSGDYLGQFWDIKQRRIWQAESQAIQVKRSAEKALKDEAMVNLVQESLEPLKRAYAEMGYRKRQAFIAMIYEYITRY